MWGGSAVGQDFTADFTCADGDVVQFGDIFDGEYSNVFVNSGQWIFTNGLTFTPNNDLFAEVSGYVIGDTYTVTWEGTNSGGGTTKLYTGQITIQSVTPASVSITNLNGSNFCSGTNIDPEIKIQVEGGEGDEWLVRVGDGITTTDYTVTDTNGDGVGTQTIYPGQISTDTQYSITYVESSDGCTMPVPSGGWPSVQYTEVLSPSILDFSSSAGDQVCSTVAPVFMVLSNQEGGVVYTLFYDDGSGPVSVGSHTGNAGSGAFTFGSFSNAGDYTVVADNGGCTETMNGSVTIEDPPATDMNVTLTGTGCEGTSHTITIENAEANVTYHLYRDGTFVESNSRTTVGDLPFSSQTGAGLYTIEAEKGTICPVEVLDQYVEISAMPVVQDVTGTGGCEFDNIVIGLADAEAGVAYTLLRDGTNVVQIVPPGSSGGFDFASVSAAGDYTVEADNNGCTQTMNGTVTLSPAPDPTLNVAITSGSGCSGNSHTITVENSESDVDYSLYLGGTEVRSPRPGTGGDLDFTGVIWAGNYEVLAERNSCDVYLNQTVTIDKTPDDQIISNPEGCEGTDHHVALDGSENGFEYSLYDGSSNLLETIIGDGSPIAFSGAINTAGTYTVEAVNPAGSGCSRYIGDVTIHTTPDLSYSLSVSNDPACEGTNHVFTLSLSETGVTYHLYRDNIITGTRVDSKVGDGNPVDFAAQSVAGTYLVTADNNGCEYQLPNADGEIHKQPVDYTISESDACAGETVTITVDNTESDVTYILYRDGSPYGSDLSGTGGSIDFTAQYPEGTYTVVGESGGCTTMMDGNVVVNPLPNVSISGLASDYCANTGDVTISGSPVTGTNNWRVLGYTSPAPAWFHDNGNETATFNVDDALAASGENSYTFIYTYTDPNTGCTNDASGTTIFHDDINDNIVVHYREAGSSDPWLDMPTASDLVLCQTDNPIELEAYFVDTSNPINDGNYSASGLGLTDNADGTAEFDPSVAGNGNHTITYTYTDPVTTCTGTITHTIQIGTTLEFPGLNSLYCAADGPVNVYGDEVPSSGISGTLEIFDNTNPAIPVPIYTQSGNSAAIPFSFDPSTEGAGDYLFRFTYNDGTCNNIIEQEVTVADEIDATFTLDAPSTQFCETQGPVELVPNQTGGVFTINTATGGGVSGYYFNPSHPDIIPGTTYTITYTINTGACSDSYSLNVNVIAAPTIDISGLISDYCDNDNGTHLIGPNNDGISGAVYTFSSTLNGVGRSPLYYDDGIDTTHVASYSYTGSTGDPLYFDPSHVGYGTYTITYTFDNTANTGCVTSVSETVTVHEIPGVTFEGTTDPIEYCQSDDPVTLKGSFVGGGFTGKGNFFGDGIDNLIPGDGVADFDPSVVIPGDHLIQYVYVDPATGCSSERTKTFTVKETPAVYNVIPNSAITSHPGHFCPGGDVTIGVDDSQDGVTYELILNDNFSTPIATAPGNASAGAIYFDPVSTPGDYTVRAVWPSPSGCAAMMNGTVEVRENNVTASISKNNVSCNGVSDGQITVSASGGSGPYHYYLYDDAATPNLLDDNSSGIFSSLSADTYNIQVEDAIGCTLPSPVEVTITEPASALSITTGSSPVGCSGCTTGVDCEGEAWVNISGGTAFADLTAYPSGYDVQWTDGGGNPVASVGNGTRIEQMPAGFYTVRVTDANGCWVETVVEIETVPDIALTEISRTPVDCNGSATGAFTVEAVGGDPSASYQFSLDLSSWLSPDMAGGNQRTFTGLSAGTYDVYVRDANYPRCEYQLGTPIVISEPAPLTVSELPGSHIDVDCYGNSTGQFEVQATGGTGAYEFSLNGGAFAAEDVFIGLSAGSYSVTVRDVNGCTASLTTPVEISQPSQLVIADYSSTPVSCYSGKDGIISVTASGGDGNYVYSITAGPETRPNQSGDTFNNLPAGTYEVTVTDGNGCPTTYSGIVVGEPASLLSLTGVVDQPVLCRGGSTGELTVTASGGSGGYEFSIDGGTNWVTDNTNQYTFGGLVAGTYTIDVRDVKGCTTNTSVSVNEPATAFSLIGSVDNHVTCYDGSDAEITVDGNGGSSASGVNYVIYKDISGAWVAQASHYDGVGDPYTFTGLDAGDYRIEAWDDNNCTDIVDLTVNQPASGIEINAVAINNVTTPGGSDGSIEITITGGSGSYPTINWDGTLEGGGTATGLVNNVYVQPNLAAGTYTVEVTDDNGCTVMSDPFVVTDPDSPLGLSISKSDPGPCHGATNGTIGLTATGGVPPYASITLSRSGTVIPSATSGSDYANYNNLGEGTYEAKVIDDAGNSYTETITFTLPPELTLDFAIDNDATCAGNSDGAVTFSVSGGTPGTTTPDTYDYYITPPSGSVISGTVAVGGSETVSTLAAGTGYKLQIVDAVECYVETFFDINEPDPITFDIESENLSCFGSDDGEISVSNVHGGWGSNYGYAWEVYNGSSWDPYPSSGQATTSTVTGLPAGTYRVIVTGNLHGCTATSSGIQITQPEELELTLSGQKDITTCFGDNTGEVTLRAEGGTPLYDLTGSATKMNWNGDTYVVTGLYAGTNTFNVEDANGCTAIASTDIAEPEPLNVSIVNSQIECEPDGSGGEIEIEAAGGQVISGDYSYRVKLVNQVTANTIESIHDFLGTNPAPYTINLTNVPAGDYDVFVSDAHSSDASGCTFTGEVNLSYIDIQANVTDVTCSGAANGAIDITVSGGSGNYTFSWAKEGNPYATTSDLSGLTSGTYTLTLTDTDRGCTLDPRDFTVNNAKTLAIDASVIPVSCNGGATGAIIIDDVIDATPPVNYYLNGVLDSNNDGQWTGLTAGTYEVTAIDADGCEITKSYYVSQPLAIDFSLSTSLDCSVDYNRSIVLNGLAGGTPPYSYVWSGPGGFTQVSDVEIAGIVVGGTYSVKVTDHRGCYVTKTIEVSGKPVLTADVTPVQCNGGANGIIDLTVTGGSNNYTYSWDDPATSTTQDLSGLAVGTYVVEVTDNAQICASSDPYTTTLQVDVPEPDPIVVDSYVAHNDCGGGTPEGEINITSITGGAGGYTLTWDASPYITPGAWHQTGLPGGEYTVVITDADDCSVTRSFTVDQPDPLDFTLNVDNSDCNQNNAIEIVNPVGGTGSYEYVWAGPGVNTSGPTITTQSNLPGGEYTVTMVDVGNAHNCNVSKSVTLTKPLDVTYTVQAETCPGANNGSINITPAEGVPPYSFSWTTTDGSGLSATQEDQSGLSAGTYEVTVTDSNPNGPCTFPISDIVVPVANTITIAGDITHVRCFGASTGAININVTGGSGAYNYTWSGPDGFTSSSRNISGLEAGSYTVVVNDVISGTTCSVTRTFAVNEPATSVEITDVVVDSAECRGEATGSVDITVAGGTSPYSFQWTGPGTIPDPTLEDIDNIHSGDYNVVITDANGCVLDYQSTYGSLIHVPQPDEALSVTLVNVQDVTTTGGSDGSIEVEVSGGAGSYTILWFDENGDPVPGSTGLEVVDNLSAGIYRVYVEDEHTCSDEIINIAVTEPNATLELIVSKRNVGPCNVAGNGRITVDMIGGTLPYQSITLYDGEGQVDQVTNDNNAVFTGLPAGEYEVVGIDANGVDVREDVTILQPSALQLNASITQHVDCYSESTGIIEVSVNGGVAYEISGTYYVTLSGGPFGTAANHSPISGEVFTFDNLPAGTYTVRVIDDSNINEVAFDNDAFADGYGDGAFNMNTDCYTEQQLVVTQPEAELEISTVTGSEELCEGALPTLQIISSNWNPAARPLEVELSDGETYTVDDSPYQFQPNNVPDVGITQYSIVGFVEQGTTCNKGTATGIATVEVHPLPTARIFGNAELCTGESRDLGIELTGTSPWEVVISDGTNTWTENYTGTFNIFTVSPVANTTYEILRVTDAYCSNTGTGTADVTVNELPDVTLSGNAEICKGLSTDLTFDFTAGTGPWTVTFTENSVERTVGPIINNTYDLSVTPSVTTDYELVSIRDANGCSQPVSGSVRVTVREYPGQPLAINGSDIVCQGSTQTYSVDPVPNAVSYVWSLPTGATINHGDGTREIEVEFATNAQTGNLSVYAVNSCGAGPNRTLQINVDELPQTIGVISGPEDICQGTTGITYSVAPVADASIYNWTVPTGFSIVSGQGTARIIVDLDPALDATIGNVTVTPENNCGVSSSTSALEVAVHPLPQADAGSDQQLCGNSATLAAVDPTTINANWEGTWQVVSGYADIASPNDPSSSVTNISRGDVVLSWTVTNTAAGGNGCSISDEVTLRNNTLTVIADAEKTLTCDGSSDLYATPVPAYPNTSGRWTVESGNGVFEDASSPSTNVYELDPGSNIIRWTITQNTCESYAEVEIVNDQPDQAVIYDEAVINLCSTNTVLTANDPVEGTGEWTVEKGRATITPIGGNDYEVEVTNLARGENIIRWTISKNGHCSTYDEVIIRNNQLDVDAGDDYTTCQSSVQLDATPPPSGVVGHWTALDVASGSVVFDDGTSYQSLVSNLVNGENRLRWTLYKNGCESSDEIIITSNAPTQATVGSEQTICKNDTILSGNTPEPYETGRWTVVQGSGDFEDLNDPTTRVTGIGLGTNIYSWTIYNGNCSSSADLKVINQQVEAFAGKDTVSCDRYVNLNADPVPSGYTGLWTVESGGGGAVFDGSASDPRVGVQLAKGENILRWNVVHNQSGCSSSDVVSILVNAVENVDAGGDQIINDGSGQATMQAHLPPRGTGQWSIVIGGGNIIDPSDPNTVIENLTRGPNIFRWTVSIGNCTDYDEVEIVNGDVIEADAGPDIFTCNDEAELHSNDPENAIGRWTLGNYGAGKFEDDRDPQTRVYDIGPGENEFVWTISYGQGTSSSSDAIIVTNNRPDDARAGSDDYTCSNTYTLLGNTPDPGMGTVSWRIISGSGTLVTPDQPETEVTGLSQGENRFVYTIEKGSGNNVCYSSDTVSIINGIATEAYAGEDQTLCTDSVKLEPNVPNHGTGEWQILEGAAEFDGNMARNMARGTNRFMWVISTEYCSSVDTVTIINNEPSIPHAGRDIAVCVDSVTLSGSLDVYHTGEWTLISGSGNIEDPTAPDTKVTNLGVGENKFRWTITNGNCSDFDDVVIRNDFKKAIIRYDASTPLCVDSTVLEANNPLPGIGTWGVIGGGGSAQFEDPEDPYSVVRNLEQGENFLTWSITNGECTDVDTIRIINNRPTPADAGGNAATCDNFVYLSANTPAVGNGNWTIRNGSGVFSSLIDPSARVDDLKFGANVFRWTIEHEGCKSFDDVQIDYNTIQAKAGDDRTICSDTEILQGNNPSPGTGTWIVAGGTSQATFDDINDPNTTVRNLRKGTNRLRWTINYKGCQTYEEVAITNASPSTAYAGNTQPLCADETVLDALQPDIGTGHWEVIAGSATIASSDINNPKASVTNLAKGDNVLRWIVENGICESIDEVLIINNLPSTPFAGSDLEVCEPGHDLMAATPEYGEGYWSVVEGGGYISDVTNPRARIRNLVPGVTRLKWTVSKGQCTLSDEIVIENNTPTQSNAGPDVADCKDWSQLDANPAMHGTGEWYIVSGTGTFQNPADEGTVIENLGFGENILMWEIWNGDKCFSRDTVKIFNKVPEQSDAGNDKTICENYTTLNGNYPPDPAIGTWTVVSGAGDFDDSHSPSSIVRNIGFGDNLYKWTISYDDCVTESSVTITSKKTDAYAGEDMVVYDPEAMLNANNVGELDASWGIVGGTGEFEDPTFFNTLVSGLSEGINTFRWTINVEGCESYDDVSVEYRPTPDAGFIANADEGCWPLEVIFTNYSVGVQVRDYHWDFGDGSSSGDQNPTHTFEEPGDYPVVLTVPGPDGIEGHYQKIIRVHEHPQAAFSVMPEEVYVPGDEVRFFDLSVGAVVYEWHFGDGNTSVEPHPVHEYAESGVYNVTLHVANEFGCVDSTTIEDAVTAISKGFIKFPNAFKPRPDGGTENRPSETNNIFKPVYRDVDTYHLQIFNRWGQLIYESDDISEGWNGFYKGQLSPQAVYVWKVNGTFVNGEEFRETGTVLLVR